ncbi:chemotaxis protein CheA [Vibrio navarrensis]|uniref:chemotaxis protein CheA n=1 Tax=Vibrio navarrensis TaxID=29495 RepID=UPI00192F1A57|nr:chemotaxis protein CheA [Vibrio navarrensis]MBE3669204.1 chemotaxis protein CheA [Vibrio navarrensis]
MSDDAKFIFVQESAELLEQMEDALLAMEQSPQDEEPVNQVFRAMHTIKGAAGIFGFDCIVDFTHPVETQMDLVRKGQRNIDSAFVALLLKCKDHTERLVSTVAEGMDAEVPKELEQAGKELIEKLLQGTVPPTPLATQKTAQIDAQSAQESGRDFWIISLDFKPDALRNGLDPLSFIRYLPRIGNITDIVTLSQNLPPAEEMDAESCYLSFRISLVSDASKSAIEEVFEFAREDCDIRILPPKSLQTSYLDLLDDLPEENVQRLGEMLINIGAITEQELALALIEQSSPSPSASQQESGKPLGEILVKRQIVSEPVLDKALHKQQTNREKANKENQSIRVDANRLGHLINLVGELVISNAAVRLMVDKYQMQDAQDVVANVEALVEEIRDHALQLRMVPIGDTFSRFRRVVRDVSQELDKEIELVITGGEAELDKSVVEKIADPLTHLVRNALDHGIESPAERLANGKPSTGTLRLNALHDSGHIVIQIADDGAGLDLEKIRKKAEANGLIKADQTLSLRELTRLIFEPGLSTKEQANNLSGRGVGMDVVKRNIDALRGNVEVDSEKGKGTLVTIHLPLTLAIIDGFMVGVGSERYVIPLSMVEECVELDPAQWSSDNQRHHINLRGDMMPCLHLRDFFDVVDEERTDRENLVVVRFGRSRAGLVVDQLFGELQTVIKPLGKVFQGLKGISGATVLGNGNIALILDIQGLTSLAIKQGESSHPRRAKLSMSSHAY